MKLLTIRQAILALSALGPTAESSNPGSLGRDTNHVFRSPRTGRDVRVIARAGETDADAIKRVRERHGLQ